MLSNFRAMNVPLLDLKAQNQALEPALTEAFQRVFHSGHFILGDEVGQFEKETAAYTGAKHAIGISSGSAEYMHPTTPQSAVIIVPSFASCARS